MTVKLNFYILLLSGFEIFTLGYVTSTFQNAKAYVRKTKLEFFSRNGKISSFKMKGKNL
jgi:hypothetical protein